MTDSSEPNITLRCCNKQIWSQVIQFVSLKKKEMTKVLKDDSSICDEQDRFYKCMMNDLFEYCVESMNREHYKLQKYILIQPQSVVYQERLCRLKNDLDVIWFDGTE